MGRRERERERGQENKIFLYRSRDTFLVILE